MDHNKKLPVRLHYDYEGLRNETAWLRFVTSAIA